MHFIRTHWFALGNIALFAALVGCCLWSNCA